MDWAEPGEEPPAGLARQAGVSALVARVLYARGCRDAEAIRHHVNPPPVAEWKIGDIPGFDAALEMVERAFAQGDEI
mgnify:FL=1